MKRFQLAFLSIIIMASTAFSQSKAPKKVVIQTPTVQCDACKSRLENRLMRDEGIVSLVADPKKHTVTVVYLPDRTNIEIIKTSIANQGYDADDVTAEPDSYKRLPATCRHVIGGKPLPNKH